MDNVIKNIILAPMNVLYGFNPKMTMEIMFFLKQGRKLDLKNPRTYNEKLQWIKLNDKNPLMPKCCDKYAVREYVESRGCGSILNNLIWQGFNPEEIPFDILPQKCVIKVTYGSTYNIICEDTKKLDREEVIKKCKRWLKADILPCYGEWYYGIEKPRIIIEDYIESADDKQLRDYKVFCFNGEPRIVRVDTDRFENHKDSIFDCEWNLIENEHMGHGCAERLIEKPCCLEQLLKYAQVLSSPFLHARVDFYIIQERIVFGEITFCNGSGFDRFSSYEFDLQMGDWLDLSGGKNSENTCSRSE